MSTQLLRSCCSLLASVALIASWSASATAQVNLSAGDVAIIGWQDNGTPSDVFTIVALSELPSGTRVYFTNNGWTGTGYRPT